MCPALVREQDAVHQFRLPLNWQPSFLTTLTQSPMLISCANSNCKLQYSDTLSRCPGCLTPRRELNELEQAHSRSEQQEVEFGPWKRIGAIALITILFAAVTHYVGRDTRERILFFWLCASLPMSVSLALIGRAGTILSVVPILISFWFAIAYGSDMGGEYVHDILAGLIGITAALSAMFLALVVTVRYFSG